jgi:hypothetical protein
MARQSRMQRHFGSEQRALMRARDKALFFVASLSLAGFAAPLTASSVGASDFADQRRWRDERSTLTFAYHFQNWNQDIDGVLGENLLQSTGLATAHLRIAEALWVDLRTGAHRTSWDKLGRIADLRDTKAQATVRLPHSVRFRVGVGVPTGFTSVPLRDLRLTQEVSNRVKGFETNKLGEGTDFDVGLATAFRIRKATIGAGGAVLFKGGYTLLEAQEKYEPGRHMSISVGLDIGPPWRRLSSFVTHTRYEEDKLGGSRVFKFSDRTRVDTRLRLLGKPVSLVVHGQAIIQDANAIWDVNSVFTEKIAEPQGDELYLGCIAEIGVGSSHLLGVVNGRVVGRSTLGIERARRLDLGVGGRRKLTPSTEATVVGYLGIASQTFRAGEATPSTKVNGHFVGVEAQVSLTVW